MGSQYVKGDGSIWTPLPSIEEGRKEEKEAEEEEDWKEREKQLSWAHDAVAAAVAAATNITMAGATDQICHMHLQLGTK